MLDVCSIAVFTHNPLGIGLICLQFKTFYMPFPWLFIVSSEDPAIFAFPCAPVRKVRSGFKTMDLM